MMEKLNSLYPTISVQPDTGDSEIVFFGILMLAIISVFAINRNRMIG